MLRSLFSLVVLSLLACVAPSTRRTISAWRQRFVSHDGVRVEYRVRPGSGVPVVFVPGMSNPARDYEDNEALVTALGTRTIIAISIRGRGESDAPETGWTIAAQASDIAAVVEHEQLRRYHLAGH